MFGRSIAAAESFLGGDTVSSAGIMLYLNNSAEVFSESVIGMYRRLCLVFSTSVLPIVTSSVAGTATDPDGL